MAQQIYTADDWKKGVIHNELRKRELPKVILEELKNVGQLSELLYQKNFLSEKDHNSIENIMKDTFYKVLKHNVKQRTIFFKNKLESAYRPDLLLDERIKELQRKLDKADNFYKEQAFLGKWSKIGIGFETYRKVNDENYKRKNFSLIVFTPTQKFRDRLGGFHTVFTDKYYLWQNVIFDVSEILRFREKLIELKEDKKNSAEITDKRTEGDHKKNKSWVKQKFDKIRSDSESDNEAVERVRSAYESEFERKIGKSTVQRYVGIVE
jgi:hypothetical protein